MTSWCLRESRVAGGGITREWSSAHLRFGGDGNKAVRGALPFDTIAIATAVIANGSRRLALLLWSAPHVLLLAGSRSIKRRDLTLRRVLQMRGPCRHSSRRHDLHGCSPLACSAAHPLGMSRAFAGLGQLKLGGPLSVQPHDRLVYSMSSSGARVHAQKTTSAATGRRRPCAARATSQRKLETGAHA